MSCAVVHAALQRASTPGMCPEQYIVMRWPDGTLYAGPYSSGMAFGTELLAQALIVVTSRADALRLATFSRVEPLPATPTAKAVIP